MYQLKKINPYYRKQWDEDRKLGPLFSDRLEEVRNLSKSFAKMDSGDQERYRRHLHLLIANDPSPDIRREAVLALSHAPSAEDQVSLTQASQDDSSKVRIAACEALGQRNDDMALSLLGQLAQNDEDMSVRAAAVRAAAKSTTPEAKRILQTALNDKSPALQYQSALALQEMTGEKFGGDVARWRSYLESTSSEPSRLASSSEAKARQ
jgi:HEAT repeat protein